MITTFDNKQWTKEDLLPKMYDDTFYYGYLGQNALSSSSCKKLLKSPKEYLKKDSGSSAALVAGRIFHTMLLEPEKVKDLTIVDAQKGIAKLSLTESQMNQLTTYSNYAPKNVRY